jgi:hypothetical protein
MSSTKATSFMSKLLFVVVVADDEGMKRRQKYLSTLSSFCYFLQRFQQRARAIKRHFRGSFVL